MPLRKFLRLEGIPPLGSGARFPPWGLGSLPPPPGSGVPFPPNPGNPSRKSGARIAIIDFETQLLQKIGFRKSIFGFRAIRAIRAIAIIDFETQLLQKLGFECQFLGFGQFEQSEQSEQFKHSESSIRRPPIYEL